MLNILITLGILLVIQIYLVLYISDIIKIDEERENYYNLNLLKKFIEIVVIILVILYTCYFYLRNKVDLNYVKQITISIEIFIVLFWLYLNLVESNIIDYGSNINPFKKEHPIDDIVDEDNNIIKNSNNKRVFSKYIDKRESDFRFEKLYPNYKHSNLASSSTNKKDGLKDYSDYNGVSPDDICYRCGCMKKLDGTNFCGKDIGGAIFGCSENWKCPNCKRCQDWPNYNNTLPDKLKNNTSGGGEGGTQFECSKCQCYDSKEGVICGKKKFSGDILRCNDLCESCSLCKTSGSGDGSGSGSGNGDDNFKTVEPESNLNNIIINNLTMEQLDNLL
jgi:hypothetical protein